MNLEADLRKAHRVIAEGEVPRTVVLDLAEYASDDEDQAAAPAKAVTPHEMVKMLEAEARALDTHQSPSDMLAAASASVLPMYTATDAAQAIDAITPAHQQTYRSRAVQAELALNDARTKAASEVDKRVLAATQMAGARIYQALLAYRKVRDWTKADVETRVSARMKRHEASLQAIQNEIKANKDRHLASIRHHIDDWKRIIGQYMQVLDSAAELLKEMVTAEKKEVAKESTKVALALTRAIQSILTKAVQDVDKLSEPTDALHAMSMLRHGIDDSSREIQTVVKDQLGIRPSFDATRNSEMEDFLRKTKDDIARSTTALELTKAALQKPGLSEDAKFGYQQNIAALKSTIQKSKDYEASIETDLRDAQVQKIVGRLHAVCEQQAQWQQASSKLSDICARKHALLEEAFTEYARREAIEQAVCDKECETMRKLVEDTRVTKRRDLDAIVKAELVAFEGALNSIQRAHVLIMPHLLETAKDYLFSRVLLEYSQLS